MASRLRVLGSLRQIIVSAELSHKIHMRYLLAPKEMLYFPAPEVDHITALGMPNTTNKLELSGDYILYATEYSVSRDMWKFIVVHKNEEPF